LQEVMTDPVICADGFVYERAKLRVWLLASNISPRTKAPLPHRDLVSSALVRTLIEIHHPEVDLKPYR